MAGNIEDDDLENMLNEVSDAMEAQETQNAELAKARDAQLEEELDKMRSLDGPFAGVESTLLESLQGLLGGGGEESSDDYMEKFKTSVTQLLADLEGGGEVSAEEKGEFDRVRELIGVLDESDEEKAREKLAQLQPDLPEGDGKVEVKETLEKCMQALSELAVHDGDAQPLQEGQEAENDTEGHGSPGAGTNPESDAVVSAFLDVILNPELITPILMMKDAYPRWLAAHENDSTISAADRERFAKQHMKTGEIADILRDGPPKKDDEASIMKLMKLMHDFSTLGERPADLPQFTEQALAAQMENAELPPLPNPPSP